MRFRFGDCLLDSEARELQRGGVRVSLSGKATRLLELLLSERPRALSKQEILDRIWPDTFVSDANLATLIKEIRSAIDDDAREPRYIRTIHRHGYAFIGNVQRDDEPRRFIDSVAILPLEYPADDAALASLAENLANALINVLSATPGLRVAPRAASARYNAAEQEKIRLDLGVRALITGRVARNEEEVTLQAELIDLSSRSQLWGERFELDLRDPLTLIERLAREIRLRLGGGSEVTSSPRRSPPAGEAYELYLHGRHHWNRRTREGIERGIEYFEKALAIDNTLALAWSGLADSYVALGSRDLYPPNELFPKAEEAARRALTLDADLAEAHASIGAIAEVHRWNWREAEASFLRALSIDPAYVTARQWYALGQAHRGRFPEALAQLELARQNDPLSVILNSSIATVHYLARDPLRAEQSALKALDVNPHHEPAHFVRGLACASLGLTDEAIRELHRAVEISRNEPHAVAASAAYAATRGDEAAAQHGLDQLAAMSSVRHVSPVHRSVVETGLGDFAAALQSLEQAAALRSGALVYLQTDPRFDPLRGEARFIHLLSRVFG